MKDRILFFGDLLSYLRWESTLKMLMPVVRHRQKDKNSKKRILCGREWGLRFALLFF
ncbi:MAG: hypothetical protein ACPLXA_11620 [Moorellaceae bacterium]